MTPFIRLHPHDDVLIARAQLVGGTTVENVTARGLIPPATRSRCATSAGEPVRATTRSSVSPASRSRPASTCTRTT